MLFLFVQVGMFHIVFFCLGIFWLGYDIGWLSLGKPVPKKMFTRVTMDVTIGWEFTKLCSVRLLVYHLCMAAGVGANEMMWKHHPIMLG